MKVWAKLLKNQKIKEDIVLSFDCDRRPDDTDTWQRYIGELCQGLKQSRPVILSKHVQQLARHARTTFLKSDFLEQVSFDKMEVELFEEGGRKG